MINKVLPKKKSLSKTPDYPKSNPNTIKIYKVITKSAKDPSNNLLDNQKKTQLFKRT